MDVPDYNKLNKYSCREDQIKQKYPDFYQHLSNIYPNLKFQERLYWYYNNITTTPTCCICGNPVKFINSKKGYHMYCSKSCSQRSSQVQLLKKQTSLSHYGTEHPMQSSKVIQKWRHANNTSTTLALSFPNIDPGLHWNLTREELYDEFFWYLDHPTGELTLRCNKNKIIKFFQQDTFYKREKELWQEPEIKQKILLNRLKYLDKTPETLNTYDILSGFKKSAIYYGYSGFNPQLCKWVYAWIEENVGTKMDDMVVYDPCGGWGHRMIGSTEIKKYIYNDLSHPTYEGVQSIKDYFEFFNAELHNEDCLRWIPEEDYDVMFTCPPYFNLESYPCGDFSSRTDFDLFMNRLFEVFWTGPAKVFALVIQENLIDENIYKPNQKFLLSKNRAIHLTNGATVKNEEYLYMFIK